MNQAKHNLFVHLAKASWPRQQNKPCLEVPQGVAAARPEARGREAGLTVENRTRASRQGLGHGRHLSHRGCPRMPRWERCSLPAAPFPWPG